MTADTADFRRSKEHRAKTYNGYFFLIGLPILWLLSYWLVGSAIPGLDNPGKAGKVLFVFTLAGTAIVNFIFLFGFFMVQPNQTRVITLFGSYAGTERTEGLRWIWPWMGKQKVSARAHNIHSERVKINDKRGNPIDVACNVVWRVRDTAQAVFDVDDFKEFVNIQIEAGLRTVGARHPYDDFEEGETTLRGSPDVVNGELQTELNERLAVAGIVVDEAGLTHLAYASEIAGAMLRRQQADAVIAARKKVVLGAVGMVEDALEKLSRDGIVELDDERRAAMVSNLMVVLCGDRDTQPVVNAGTLYQ
ncbi:SPFH domain-containing protein [Aurantiacibacter sp. MUD11]|uniref:SPFH domain-containing protein n=1 Tax=Aurantiacibacter sp. MUD11 TaxID=3003265 RepID=UPI0022AAC6AA|nr:SPFH domain-containing protein [Aurantiacibacter sp. MUD11]WAT16988.1 SPFH domain-containing protein [Aurantiacibacter sp. MUD11]